MVGCIPHPLTPPLLRGGMLRDLPVGEGRSSIESLGLLKTLDLTPGPFPKREGESGSEFVIRDLGGLSSGL